MGFPDPSAQTGTPLPNTAWGKEGGNHQLAQIQHVEVFVVREVALAHAALAARVLLVRDYVSPVTGSAVVDGITSFFYCGLQNDLRRCFKKMFRNARKRWYEMVKIFFKSFTIFCMSFWKRRK